MPLNSKRGDTIIEILFALSVFSLIAIISINLMNNGVVSAQASLESTMVRNEINAQAEALRFVHGTATSGGSQESIKLWQDITARAIDSEAMSKHSYPPENFPCSTYYDNNSGLSIAGKNAFVLNYRQLNPPGEADKPIIGVPGGLNSPDFKEAGNYARVFYSGDESLKTDVNSRKMLAAEGIWIIGVRSQKTLSKSSKIPQYYDFYIQSCWYNPGKNTPSAIGTVIRLYNPADSGGQ